MTTLNITIEGETFERDGIWVAKAPKLGVFAYADTEADVTARLGQALRHVIAGIKTYEELIERLDRAGVKWERAAKPELRRWTRVASLVDPVGDSLLPELVFA